MIPVNIARPLKIGDRLKLSRANTPRLGSGAIRKRHAQSAVVLRDSADQDWVGHCIEWSPYCIYEVTAKHEA